MTTFGMEDFKVYITGESYAGQYIVSRDTSLIQPH